MPVIDKTSREYEMERVQRLLGIQVRGVDGRIWEIRGISGSTYQDIVNMRHIADAKPVRGKAGAWRRVDRGDVGQLFKPTAGTVIIALDNGLIEEV